MLRDGASRAPRPLYQLGYICDQPYFLIVVWTWRCSPTHLQCTVLVSPVVASWVIGLGSLKSSHLGDGKSLSNLVLGSSLDRLLTLLSLCDNVDWIRFSASWSSTFKCMPSPSLSS